MKSKKVIIVVDVLLFESLNNDNLFKHLNEDYFLLLWTSKFTTNELHNIPYDSHIYGLRNGFKPFRYLRMHLRRYHPDVLPLPVVIVDFEKNFTNSRYGYDMCIDVRNVVTRQLYNGIDINVIDTKKIFHDINEFLLNYNANNIIDALTEESIVSKSVVLTSTDIFAQVDYTDDQQQHQQQQNEKKIYTQRVPDHKSTTVPTNKKYQSINSRGRIVKKQLVLTVGWSFFNIYQNVDCRRLTELLRACYIVVWIDNKNVNKQQVQHFMSTMKLNNIKISYMLFGLDRNVKSISFIRKHLPLTQLPFVLIDNLLNIYDCNDDQYTAVCDFDYYINLHEHFVDKQRFYNMDCIIEKLRNFISSISCVNASRSQDKLKIIEYNRNNKYNDENDDDNDDDDDNNIYKDVNNYDDIVYAAYGCNDDKMIKCSSDSEPVDEYERVRKKSQYNKLNLNVSTTNHKNSSETLQTYVPNKTADDYIRSGRDDTINNDVAVCPSSFSQFASNLNTSPVSATYDGNNILASLSKRRKKNKKF